MLPTIDIFRAAIPRYPELQGKVALVTGSGRNIGRGIAIRLAREGMRVFIHGPDSAEVTRLVDELRALRVDAAGSAADFTRPDEVEGLCGQVEASLGAIDLLVNNAALLNRTGFLSIQPDLLDQELAVNLHAPFMLSQWAALTMREHGIRGSIIHLSTVGALRAHWNGLPYDLTKGGIDALTRAMALDLAEHGIRVNAVAPGAIRQDIPLLPEDEVRLREKMIPLLRFGTAQDVASLVAFLASDEAAYITGQVITIDGGLATQLYPKGQPI